MELNWEEKISLAMKVGTSPEATNELSAESIMGSLGAAETPGNDAADAEGAAESEEQDETDDGESGDDDDGAGGENAGEEELTEEDEESEEGEDEEEAEESDEESDDEEGEEEEERSSKSREAMLKRINTLTGKLRTAEEERDSGKTKIAELEAELENANRVVLAPTADNPLADVDSEQGITDRIGQMKAVRRWCQQNPEGGEVSDGKGGTITLTKEDVQERLAYAEEVMDAAPARVAFLKEQSLYTAEARRVDPDLFKTSSPKRKMADVFIRQNPGILNLPNGWLIISDAIRGMEVRTKQAKEAAAAKIKKPAAAKPKAPALRPSSTPASTVKKAGASKATARFLASGRSSDLEEAIAGGLLS